MDKLDRLAKSANGCLRCRHAGYPPYLPEEQERRLNRAFEKFGANYFCRVLDKPVTTDRGKTCKHWESDR
jgi:hypothetical protein